MKSPRLAAVVSILLAGSPCLHAAPLFWDPNITTGAALGGTGSWDQVSGLWYNGSGDVAWNNGNSDDAFFTGTSGVVTLTGNISAADLFFTNTTGSYVLTNATGMETLTLVSGTIDTGGTNHIISVPIAGNAQITKSGVGRVSFTADNSTSYTGPGFLVANGYLSIQNSNGLAGPSANVVVTNGAAVEFNAATTQITNLTSFTISGSGPAGEGAIDALGATSFSEGAVTLAGDTTLGVDGGPLEFDGGLNGTGQDLNLSIVGTNATGLMLLTVGGINLGNNGALTVGCAGTFNINQGVGATATYSNLVVTNGFFKLNGQEANLGTVPTTLITNQIYLNGGTLETSATAFTLNTKRGITVGPNGGTIEVFSGNLTTCGIYSANNPVTFNCFGGNATDLTLGAPINIGTARYTKTGPMTMNLGGQANIEGGITLNQGNLSWTSSTAPLGPPPSTYVSNWFTLNGGNVLPSNSQTIEANRGIFCGTNGSGIGENTTSGNLTIACIIMGPGNWTKLTGGTGSSVILTGSNTFTGNVTIQGNFLRVGAGGSTGTLGSGNNVVSIAAATSTLIFNRSDAAYSYGGSIIGSGTLTNLGTGTITLTHSNAYTGGTTVSAGKLLINNTTGSGTGTGAVLVLTNAALGGTGFINGTVTANAGSTLAPGTPTSPLGKLTISNNLSIAGNVAVSVNRSLQTNSVVAVTGTLANTGTGKVIVTNLGPILVAGDRFVLFSQPVTGGNTLTITGASGVTWTNNLAVDGSISVVKPSPNPVVNSFSLSGTNLVLSGTNGYTSGGYYLLSSTNILQPASSWARVLTNTFDTNGNFSITNNLTTNAQRFYLLQLQ